MLIMKKLSKTWKKKENDHRSKKLTSLFLEKVIILAYTMNNLPVAQKYYMYLKDKYPGEIGNLSFPDYVASTFVTRLDEAYISEITDILFGILYQSYWSLAIGEDERAVGLQSLAKVIYERTAKKLPSFQTLFPTFDALKKSVLDSFTYYVTSPARHIPPQSFRNTGTCRDRKVNNTILQKILEYFLPGHSHSVTYLLLFIFRDFDGVF